MAFSGQEYRSGLPCPSLGDFPKPGIKPTSPALQADFFTDWASREALIIGTEVQIHCHLPLHASSSAPCDLSLDAILFSQFFIGLLTGRLGRRYSHLLITYSSLLLLWSKEKPTGSKILCDQKVWKVCLGQRWIEPGGAWFKVSHNIVLLKWQIKGGLLQRAFSCWKLLIEGLVTPSL